MAPVQHPSSTLFYMFEEVERTGIWKPTACPHCENIQRNEDSDSLHAAPVHVSNEQSAKNNGQFLGDGSGSNYMTEILYFL